MRRVNLRSETGASLFEYALGLALICIVVVGASVALKEAAKQRAQSSENIMQNAAPCGGEGGNLEGNECF